VAARRLKKERIAIEARRTGRRPKRSAAWPDIGPLQTAPGVYITSSRTENVGKSRVFGVDAETRFQLTPNDLLSLDLQYLNSQYTSFGYAQLSAAAHRPGWLCDHS
jgi:hypothetical protein